MSGPDTLTEYRRKRDICRTREPGGKRGAESDSAPGLVVRIHDAGSMHVDFRPKAEGVLGSWSVPKGPSGDPHDKRPATPTEDHPLAYRDFEGTTAGRLRRPGHLSLRDDRRPTDAIRERGTS